MMDPADADSFVHAIARNWREAPLSEADRALCEYAVKLTGDQHKMTSADLDILRAHEFRRPRYP